MAETITRDELKAKIDRGEDLILLETLPEDYYRQGHLPGALNLPYEQAQDLAPQLLPDKEAEIVTYCMNFT